MSNAIKWISKEAKRLRKARPNKFKKWSQYIKEASNKYARLPKKKRRRVGVSATPAGLPLYSPRRKAMKGIKTTSRSHTDKNKITANIQVGSKKKFKSRARPGEYPPPISWHVVKMHDTGFEKKGKDYKTISMTFSRRIVWQTWEAAQAKKWLAEHCIKSR